MLETKWVWNIESMDPKHPGVDSDRASNEHHEGCAACPSAVYSITVPLGCCRACCLLLQQRRCLALILQGCAAVRALCTLGVRRLAQQRYVVYCIHTSCQSYIPKMRLHQLRRTIVSTSGTRQLCPHSLEAANHGASYRAHIKQFMLVLVSWDEAVRELRLE